jgi:hypothetical protein
MSEAQFARIQAVASEFAVEEGTLTSSEDWAGGHMSGPPWGV